MSKVATEKLRMAAMFCTVEFMKFSNAYNVYRSRVDDYSNYMNGTRTFKTAELTNPEQDLYQAYIDAAEIAINKLYTVDRAFMRKEGVHIVTKLESLNDVLAALEEITDWVEETMARERELRMKTAK